MQLFIRFWQAQRLGYILLLAIIYYETANMCRFLASTPQDITPVWFPDGIASATVILLGYWILPGVFIGSFLSNFLAFINFHNIWSFIISILAISGIAIGTTLG